MKCWKKERITIMTSMSLIGHVLPPHLSTSKITNFTPQNVTPKPILFTNLISLALTVTLNSPLPSLAIPSLNSQPPLLSPTTPFSQSKNLQIGLENGKIRPCPSTNPGCVSTNPQSSSFAFPWSIPENDTGNAIQKLEEAILKTQKNAKIQVIEDTPNGKYLQAEVDGGFDPDVLEFLVRGDVVAYRSMATKVTYVYPFTTAFGDSKGQEERMKKILNELGWQESRVNVQIFNGERVNNSNQKTITHSLVSVSSCPHNIYSFFDGKKTRTNMSDLSSE